MQFLARCQLSLRLEEHAHLSDVKLRVGRFSNDCGNLRISCKEHKVIADHQVGCQEVIFTSEYSKYRRVIADTSNVFERK